MAPRRGMSERDTTPTIDLRFVRSKGAPDCGRPAAGGRQEACITRPSGASTSHFGMIEMDRWLATARFMSPRPNSKLKRGKILSAIT